MNMLSTPLLIPSKPSILGYEGFESALLAPFHISGGLHGLA